MSGRQKVLVIVGTTSSGKSALAVELARKFNGEVVSADSRQVYEGLDIGTGKITKREMKGVPHHLLDVVSPKKIFTAHDFVEQADRAIADIASRNKLPIVAGGTGFYIDALLRRISLPHVPTNRRLRTALEKKTAEQLFAMLKKRDGRRAKTIDHHNKHRLIRALEIVNALGAVPKPIPANGKDRDKHNAKPYDVLWLGLTLQSKVTQTKIAARLKARLKRGMIAEAKRLRKSGVSLRRMRQLGLEYRALADYLAGKLPRAELETSLVIAIRRFAKRQLTYWRRNSKIRWLKPTQGPAIAKAVARWLDVAK